MERKFWVFQITLNNLQLNYYKIWERERVENISIYDKTDCSWSIIQGGGNLEQVDWSYDNLYRTKCRCRY